MNPDQLIMEARARIIWGESSSSVRDFLISNGISDMDADAPQPEHKSIPDISASDIIE
jgi:hypothetical protein